MKHDVRVTDILRFVAYIPRNVELARSLSSILTEMREARLAGDVQIFRVVKVGLGHDSR